MINLIYIRAAIRERTGKELSLEAVRDLLLEEGLITKVQAQDKDLIFRGYAEYFETEEASAKIEDPNPFIFRTIKHEDD
jgi:hypothetical protein